jgi:uncharacterized delta-60 repeat protein
MNYIDLKNFRKYEQLFGDNGPAKIGHVNYVIKNTNEDIANLQDQINNLPIGGGSYLYAGNTGVTTTVDWSAATIQEIEVVGDTTFIFSNGVPGQLYTLLLKQQTVGQQTASWPVNVIWSGSTSPTLSKVPNFIKDSTFNVGTGFGSFTYSNLAIQSDGKIIVGGSFISYNGTLINRIMRLNSDGTIDGTFNVGSGANGEVRVAAIQTDGKILIGGNFNSYDGNFVNYIARINTDGSFDPTFNTGGGFDQMVRDIKIQSDGKVICAGEFYTFDGNSSTSIVRLNTDGSYDATFVVGMGFNNRVDIIVIENTGKIICGGPFNAYDITNVNGIIRLNSDGSPDASFATNIGTGFDFGSPETIAIQNDGKILCGGGFETFNGIQSFKIARLNIDGSFDNTFNIGTGFNNGVTSIEIQPSDGKIIAGGFFTLFNGESISRIARINTDGSLDTSFGPGLGFNDGVINFGLQADEKIITLGYFTQFNGESAPSIIRLMETTPILSYNKFSFVYNGMNYIGSY